jgi:hypothetical protein
VLPAVTVPVMLVNRLVRTISSPPTVSPARKLAPLSVMSWPFSRTAFSIHPCGTFAIRISRPPARPPISKEPSGCTTPLPPIIDIAGPSVSMGVASTRIAGPPSGPAASLERHRPGRPSALGRHDQHMADVVAATVTGTEPTSGSLPPPGPPSLIIVKTIVCRSPAPPEVNTWAPRVCSV